MMFSFIMFLCLVCCSLAGTSAGDKSVTNKANIFLELLGIKQLINEESLHRLDLERQIRELRAKSEKGAIYTTFSKDVLNETLSSLKENIVSEMESSVAQNIEKILPFLTKMEYALEKADEQMTHFTKLLGKLGENDGIDTACSRGNKSTFLFCIE